MSLSLSKLALAAYAAITTILPGTVLGGTPESCPNPQLSCHNTTAVDTCCFNYPGGVLLQTQFWDYDPSTGPSDSWTIHGLWPDNCDKRTFSANCDSKRAYTNITQIIQSFGETELLSYMQKYWVSNEGSAESFWEHEWGKHGTCVSTLDPDCYTGYKVSYGKTPIDVDIFCCTVKAIYNLRPYLASNDTLAKRYEQPTQEVVDYFQKTVDLFKELDTYQFLSDAGITPSSSKTYTLSQINSALQSAFGQNVLVQCDDSNALTEAWYFYNVKGSVQTGTFVPTGSGGSSSCSSSGIKYPPKSGGTPTTSSPTSTPTGSFNGNGYLNVYQSGSKSGCLISYGTWYTSGTCATYTATKSGSGFTLRTSKGNCGIASDGSFSCSSSISQATVFGSSGGYLTYQGSSEFSADAVASGSDQERVFTGSGSVNLKMTWQNA